MKRKIVIIAGATASGKSIQAMHMAHSLDGVIINADSQQVYMDIPILTAQPSEQDRKLLDHRLYGIIKCSDSFSVGKWLKMVLSEIQEAKSHGKIPIVVGGTGLYLRALVEGFAEIPPISAKTLNNIAALDASSSNGTIYDLLKQVDKVLYQQLKLNDRQRILRALSVYYDTGIALSEWQKRSKRLFPREDFYTILLNPSREQVYSNCNSRFLKMINSGVVEEVKRLMLVYPHAKYLKVLGLSELIEYVDGRSALDSAIAIAQKHTRNYAKRQMTWFRHQMKYDRVTESLLANFQIE